MYEYEVSYTSITHDDAGCPRDQANKCKSVLSQQDASALVGLLEAYERWEGVSVVGDKREGGQGKVARL